MTIVKTPKELIRLFCKKNSLPKSAFLELEDLAIFLMGIAIADAPTKVFLAGKSPGIREELVSRHVNPHGYDFPTRKED